MNKIFRFAIGVACTCCAIVLAGCSSSEPTVIEPENDAQLEMMRQMVESESQATDESDQNRPKD